VLISWNHVVHYLQFVTGMTIKSLFLIILATSQKSKPGHKSSKTTEIYTHVSNKNIGKITNPLDLIYGNTYRENDVNNDG